MRKLGLAFVALLLVACDRSPVAPSATPATDFRGAVHRNAVALAPLDGIQSLETQVEALRAAGVLGHGQAVGLMEKLAAAMESLNRGSDRAACNQLRAFTNQVDAFLHAGVLPGAVAQGLTDAAMRVQAHVGCPGIAGPLPNSVRLESDAGDYIGGGRSYSYTQANAVIVVTANAGHLRVSIDGDEWWFGDFQTPNTLSQLEPGEYTDLQRYPFHDPAKGGMDWFGEGRGCNTLSGWFIVDSVTYDGGALAAVDLRFEQHCEGRTAALHGAIHWRSDDVTAPPGPVYPVPAGLWQPSPGSTPLEGSFVYLTSEQGDYIGGGQSYTYTLANATIVLTASGNHVSVVVNGAESWHGDFQTMNTLSQLEPGYYADLRRYPFHNPTKGGLSWSGQGRGCNTLEGWFAIDRVTYSGGSLTALDLRFEQRCEGGSAALHGAIHWAE